MRKQVLLGMIMFAMGASFIGCGKSDNKAETNTPTVVSESNVVDKSTEAKTEAKADTSDWITYSLDPNGSVKYPKDYTYGTDIGRYLQKKGSNYYIIMDGGYETQKLCDSSYDATFNDLMGRIGSSHWTCMGTPNLLKDVKVECVKKESCKINGHDAYRYTAKTTGAANNKECYIYGYLSSTPRSSFAIYGIITDDSQAEALKKEIQTEVDAIMNTFETK